MALILVGILIVSGSFFLWRSQYERKHLSIEHFDFYSMKLVPETKSTIVFLSDLHDNQFGYKNKDLLNAIDRIRPDLILIGGDMMICKGRKNIQTAVELICSLSKKYRVCCGNGNHETRMKRKTQIYGKQYEEYVRTLRSCGVIYLEDEKVTLPLKKIDNSKITVSSVDLDRCYYKKFRTPAMDVEYLNRKLGKADSRHPQILLLHSPLYFKTAAEWGSDLVLSGHFHGGTIRLPLLGALMSPQLQIFPKYAEGNFAEYGSQMIVSRGLGTHSINIRINNRPQLVVIAIHGKQNK